MECNATEPDPQGLSPAGFLRSRIEEGFGAGVVIEQCPAIGNRVLHDDPAIASDAAERLVCG
jgi:hypothetical protein